ncbi:hypothetical protein BDR07DRAFT_955077 [Suillus spraguei]|nr:hypothetical protein BDR07DRAFT_955077 [Suillus spraguei]
MSGLESIYALDRNNSMSVAIITLILYDYVLQFEKEVTFVWERRLSVMSYLYLAVSSTLPNGFMVSLFCCYARSDILVFSLQLLTPAGEVYFICLKLSWYVSANAMELFCIFLLGGSHSHLASLCPIRPIQAHTLCSIGVAPTCYCDLYSDGYIFMESTLSDLIARNNNGSKHQVLHGCLPRWPMTAIYASIPVICYDILLLVLAIIVLGKHLKERKELKMKPNTYVVMIVRYHVIYFVMNLTSQIFMAILWINLPTVVMSLVLFFNATAPFIIVPRLIISIWDTHAKDSGVHSISTIFEDCICWTSPPTLEQHETDYSV